MFSVGDRIVYPMQGAGVIQDIEEKRILGESKQYYILRLPCSDINIMIPVDSGESIGIREVSAREEMEDVLRLLGDESTPIGTLTGTAAIVRIWISSRAVTSDRWPRS